MTGLLTQFLEAGRSLLRRYGTARLPMAPTKEIEDPLLRRLGLAGMWRIFTQRLSPAGRWFLLVTALFFGFGSASLDVQTYVPLLYASVLWGLALLAVLAWRPRVAVQARHAERIGAGEVLPVEVEVEARRSGADLWVLPHRLPGAIDAVPENGVPLPPLRRGQKAKVRLGLQCARRGVFKLRGFRVETDFPFGLLQSCHTFREERTLLVYPQFRPLTRCALPSGRRYQPGGVALAAVRGDSFEFVGNREYREGDNVRDIDWLATARLGKPIVREYREEYFLRVAVILDTHLPPDAGEAQREAFEHAVSLCAAVGDFMAGQDYLVDILAAGPHLYHLTAGLGLAYLDQILDILACVEANPDEPFETLEPAIQENLSRITTMICLFLDWTASRRDFVHKLAAQGAAIKVVIVRDEPCTLDPAFDAALLGEVPVLSRADCQRGVTAL